MKFVKSMSCAGFVDWPGNGREERDSKDKRFKQVIAGTCDGNVDSQGGFPALQRRRGARVVFIVIRRLATGDGTKAHKVPSGFLREEEKSELAQLDNHAQRGSHGVLFFTRPSQSINRQWDYLH